MIPKKLYAPFYSPKCSSFWPFGIWDFQVFFRYKFLGKRNLSLTTPNYHIIDIASSVMFTSLYRYIKILEECSFCFLRFWAVKFLQKFYINPPKYLQMFTSENGVIVEISIFGFICNVNTPQPLQLSVGILSAKFSEIFLKLIAAKHCL